MIIETVHAVVMEADAECSLTWNYSDNNYFNIFRYPLKHCPVDWGCRIYRLHLCIRNILCPYYITCNPIYPTPLPGQDMTEGQFFSGV